MLHNNIILGMATPWLELGLVIAGIMIICWLVMEERNFNMDLIANRPQYPPAVRERYDPTMVVEETIAYPRSGQPFQFKQRVEQDGRKLSDDQLNKLLSLFDAAGKPIRAWHPGSPTMVRNKPLSGGNDAVAMPQKFTDEAAAPDNKQILGYDTGGSMKKQLKGIVPGGYHFADTSFPTDDPNVQDYETYNHGWTNTGRPVETQDLATSGYLTGRNFSPGSTSFTSGSSSLSQKKSAALMVGRGESDAQGMRQMAELDFGKFNPLMDPNMAATSSSADASGGYARATNINTGGDPPIDQNEWTIDPLSKGIVNVNETGPEALPYMARWTPSGLSNSVVPIDDPAARERRGPLVLPTGGIIEPYTDYNKYTLNGQTDYAMVDGLPFNPLKTMIGEGGKVYTGLAYRPTELNPHLDLLPANHPLVLQTKHWEAAAILNNLPPTERRKNLERTLIADVKRYRNVPKSYGGA